jgi:hypothetical protein
MKKVLLLILPLLWIAGAVGQTTPCWYDSLRLSLFVTNPKAQQDEDLFYYRLNKWRNKNTLNLYPTPMPANCGGCLQILPTCFKAKFIIPVVIHVVHRSVDNTIGIGSNISVNQIQNQLDALNRYFANYDNTNPKSTNTGIQFCLAPVGSNNDGIIRISDTTIGQTVTNHKMSDFKKLMDLKPVYLAYEDYLHIYIVNDLVDPSGQHSGVQGYATFPGTTPQGIIIRYKRFGDSSTCVGCKIDYNAQGKVLVHEVGHYLGIQHPFEDSCSGITNATCATQGDKCCDVPPVGFANHGCSNPAPNSCNETPTDLPDMIENYMDYTNDFCRNTFTKNQTEIMHFTLLTSRARLVSTDNINAINLACCSFSAKFSASNNILCKSDSVKFTAFKYSGQATIYKWTIKRGDTVKYTTSSSSYKFTWKPPTYYAKYKVILKVIISGDSAVDSTSDMVQVINCGLPVKSTQGNWYFGEFAGLRFMQNAIIPDPRPSKNPKTINTGEGCISVSDSLGNLLFYGGGIKWEAETGCPIFDQNHDQASVKNTIKYIPPGSGTSTQGIVSFPNPANRAQYLIFTNESNTEPTKLYLTVFDTTEGAYGKLLQTNFASGINTFPNFTKSSYLLSPFPNILDTTCLVNEQLAAVSQCNGKDYWLLTVTDSISDITNHIRHLTSYNVKSPTNILATGRKNINHLRLRGQSRCLQMEA